MLFGLLRRATGCGSVINQQINLYQERFHQKILLVSARNSLLALVVVLLMLTIATFLVQSSLAEIQRQNEQLLSQRDAASQSLAVLQAELQRQLDDDSVDRALASIRREIRARERMLDFIEQNQFGSGKGFSSQLSALSELQEKGLWLSEIALSANYIKLSGSALDEPAVPRYFNQFRQRDLFTGRVFDVFELGRDQEQNWKVDFVIASRPESDE